MNPDDHYGRNFSKFYFLCYTSEPPKKLWKILFSTLIYIEKKKFMFHTFSSGSGDGLKSRELSSGGDRLGSVFGDGLSGGGGNGLGPGSGGPAAVSDWTTAIDSVAVK